VTIFYVPPDVLYAASAIRHFIGLGQQLLRLFYPIQAHTLAVSVPGRVFAEPYKMRRARLAHGGNRGQLSFLR
jgi:hypothetical protein